MKVKKCEQNKCIRQHLPVIHFSRQTPPPQNIGTPNCFSKIIYQPFPPPLPPLQYKKWGCSQYLTEADHLLVLLV